MGTYTDFAVVVTIGLALGWLVRLAWRASSRRTNRTDVSPVSEQWLAERRGKQD
jgi:hypothetical protein